jgi:hypothetical protein
LKKAKRGTIQTLVPCYVLFREVEKKKKNLLKLQSTNQEQIIEESKVKPNLDSVTFYVLFREWRRKEKTAPPNPKPQACNLETLTLAV